MTQRQESALLAALYRGDRDKVGRLLEQKPRLDIFEAAALGDLERVKELVEGNPELVDAFASDGFFPLGLAAFFGKKDVVEYLLQHGADVNARARNSFRVQALHAAVAHHHNEIAAALLAAGADANSRQQAGFTPLHAAAHYGDQELIRLLLAHGADAEAKDDKGATPRDLAAAQGHSGVAEWLSVRRAGVLGAD